MAKKRKKPEGAQVLDLEKARLDQLTAKFQGLARAHTRAQDEAVRLILDAYRAWERANPEAALKNYVKLAMVRYGFVGPGGFDRCHEAHRLPDAAFFGPDDLVEDELDDDRSASDVVMCPAMNLRRCEGVWAGIQMPPCYLLLLEVYEGLGGDALDDKVQIVIDDFGKWEGPEKYRKSFVRAEKLLRKYRDVE